MKFQIGDIVKVTGSKGGCENVSENKCINCLGLGQGQKLRIDSYNEDTAKYDVHGLDEDGQNCNILEDDLSFYYTWKERLE